MTITVATLRKVILFSAFVATMAAMAQAQYSTDPEVAVHKIGPQAPAVYANSSNIGTDVICDAANSQGFTCSAVGTTETFFANAITLDGKFTAGTIDGQHQGIEFTDTFDQIGNGSTFTLKLNACSSLSGGVCANRVVLWQPATTSGGSGASFVNYPADCTVIAGPTLGQVGAICNFRGSGENVGTQTVSSGLTNGSTNWVLAWSVTYTTGSISEAIARVMTDGGRYFD